MKLFEPVRIGSLELKNRLVMPPMKSRLAEPGGTVSQRQLHQARYASGVARLAQAIKQNGARAAIQVHHPGRQAPSKVTGTQAVGPSPIPPRSGEMPRELTPGEIEAIVEEFAQAARRAKEAGFEAVEVHGAHGYLLCPFLSPYSNPRRGDYGGDQ